LSKAQATRLAKQRNERQSGSGRGLVGRVWLLLLAVVLLAAPAEAQQRRKKQPTRKATRTASHSRRQRQPKSKEQLERERQANLRQIAEAGQQLNQTQEKKKASLGQLNVIKEKLTQKHEVIAGISTQLKGIETGVHQTAQQVLKTQKNLAELKAEYARLLYTASKTSNGFNRLMFLFASESFNQFSLRLRYIRQYTEERQRQAARIMGTQQRLSQQLNGLAEQQKRKSQLLNVQLSESQNLLSLKTQQDQMVQQLSQQEQGLRQELEQRQQAVQRLNSLIAERVREEIARAARAERLAARRAAARRSAASRSGSRSSRNSEAGEATAAARDDASANPESDAPETAAEKAADRRATRVALTPETALISSSFSGNKGHLPWPVSRGFISQHFGRHQHPVLKHVVVENRGVDIQTDEGAAVRSCFDGKVLTITNIAGMGTIVMIQHADFFTVYAKLRSVNVSENQHVNARDAIGTVATNGEGDAEVHFEIWHNSSNLNPETWLGRKR
jgi:septal ring factor EnvC (AmiA/AmiB activator)